MLTESQQATPERVPRNVLIVDDDADFAASLVAVLEPRGQLKLQAMWCFSNLYQSNVGIGPISCWYGMADVICKNKIIKKNYFKFKFDFYDYDSILYFY